jgi:O-antigen ligase
MRNALGSCSSPTRRNSSITRIASRSSFSNSMRPYNNRVGPFLVGTNRHSGLDRLAFAFLWLMVFAIPWQNAVMVPGVGTIARLIGALAGVLGIFAIIESQGIRLPSLGHVLTTLFVLWGAASYCWTLDPEETLVAAGSSIQLLVMVWLIWELASRQRDQRRLMQAYVLGTYVSGIDTVYRYFFHLESKLVNRYTSTGFNPNDLALFMALSIPVSYYLAIQSKGLTAWVYRAQLILAGTTILLTASRDGLLASLVAVAIVPLTFARLTWPQRIANILTVAVLVCSGLLFVPAASWKRLSTIPEELSQGTLNERRLVWDAGKEVFRIHPFQGVGAGAFAQRVGRTLGAEPRVAHNTFLSVLVEEGVIGFGLFCALIGVLGVSAYQMPPLAQKLWVVTLGVWVVGVCGATWEREKPTWLFFSLLMGHWASLVQKRRTRGQAQGLVAHPSRCTA